MFKPDIINLRQFYATPLGEAVQLLISASVHELWPELGRDSMLAIGFASPYLESYRNGGAQPLMICMPAQQGASHWPQDGQNQVFLAHESELPLPENSINRVLLLHSIEHSEHLSWLMEEIWRVLVPGGRALAIVPNRHSFWARSSRSPFGYGRPFSTLQLRELMTAHRLTLTRSGSAVFIPPVHSRLMWRIAGKLERAGKLLCPFLGGVLLVEAEKQVYASIKQPVSVPRKAYRPVPIPATQPAMGMK